MIDQETLSNMILDGTFGEFSHNDSSNQNGSGELIHYGILGMKWGVRRTPEQLGNKRKRNESAAERKVRLEREFEERTQKRNIKDNARSEKMQLKATKAVLKSQEKERKDAQKLERLQQKTEAERLKYQRQQEKTKQEELKKKKTNSTKKDVKSMSDQEIRDAIQRLQLEQQYKTLIKKKQPIIEFGKRIVVGSAETIAKQQIAKYANQGIEHLMANKSKNSSKKDDKDNVLALPPHEEKKKK